MRLTKKQIRYNYKIVQRILRNYYHNQKNIQVHHLHYDNVFNEEPEDLVLLCKDCHKQEHGIK